MASELPSRILRASLFALMLCVPGIAHAADDDATRAVARKLGNDGVEAYQKGDYASAGDKLGRAYAALKVPSLGLWSARALVKLNRWVEASERYLEVTRLSVTSGDVAVQKKAQEDAEADRAALLPRIPNLVVSVSGASAAAVTLSVDGKPVASSLIGESIPADPGSHKVVVEHDGKRFEQTVVLAETETKSAVFELSSQAGAPAAVPDPGASSPGSSAPIDAGPAGSESASGSSGSGRKLLGWVAIGVGGAGLAAGGVTGLLAMSQFNELDCPDDTCASSKKDEVSSYNTLRTVSTVSFIAGGVLAAAGVTLVLTSPSESPQATRVSGFVGLNQVGVRGVFR